MTYVHVNMNFIDGIKKITDVLPTYTYTYTYYIFMSPL